VSTVAAASTSHGLATSLASGSLTHGFQTSFYILTGLALLGAAIAVGFVAPSRRPAVIESPVATETIEPFEEAA